MIPLNFYRDDNYVYYNNPNGITKKMTIADFEAMMSGESELPTYSSSTNGKVLSVDSDGDLEWASLPPAELPEYSSSNSGEVLSVDSNGDLDWISLQPSGGGAFHIGLDSNFALDKKWSEINTAIRGGSLCIIDFNGGDSGDSFDYANYLVLYVSKSLDTSLNPKYGVSCVAIDSGATAVYKFSTTTADGYPTYES